MLLGAWGAIVPFVGPYFGYAYSPDKAWAYNSGRLWLSIVPGAVVFLGGLMVLSGAGRFGGLLAALGGAWFVVGQPVIALAFPSGSITAGTPAVSSGAVFSAATMRFLEGLGFFYGLGVVIVFFAALAIGRQAAARATATLEADTTAFLSNETEYGRSY
jgi:hypothetical protein